MARALTDVEVVVFDLDGTVVDSAPDLADAVSSVLTEHGLAAASELEVRRWIGDGALALVQRAWTARRGPASPDWDALLHELREAYAARVAVRTTIYPGIVDTLAWLRSLGIEAALCTNKPMRHTQLLLDALQLAAWFPVVVGGDTLSVRKPDPAPLRLACGGRRAWMVGDGAADVAAAHAAGVPILVAGWGYATPQVLAGAEWRCDASDGLRGALARGPGAR